MYVNNTRARAPHMFEKIEYMCVCVYIERFCAAAPLDEFKDGIIDSRAKKKLNDMVEES